MSTGKVAAAAVLGVGAVLILQGGDSAGIGYHLVWRETGLLGAPARAVVCIIAGFSLLAVVWLHRLLFRPLELLKVLEDVGYIAEDGRSRARAANEVRRRRKIGELPPVYPNGWYRALDSHMLERGEVRSVTVLGMGSNGGCSHQYKNKHTNCYCNITVAPPSHTHTHTKYRTSSHSQVHGEINRHSNIVSVISILTCYSVKTLFFI